MAWILHYIKVAIVEEGNRNKYKKRGKIYGEN